jgi:hypothetical protein
MPSLPGVCIVSDAIYDIRPEQYPTVIREMIRHENDLTNHRIMWLLVGQGFIANAYVSVKDEVTSAHSMLAIVGMVVALSAFFMLYRSYEAKGYLQFLGKEAKQGALKEEYLPLVGWPRNRIKGWRNDWICQWIRRLRDLLEPWLLLPYVFISLWMTALLHARSRLNHAIIYTLALILSAVILSMSCIVLVWLQGKDDMVTET